MARQPGRPAARRMALAIAIGVAIAIILVLTFRSRQDEVSSNPGTQTDAARS